jgi:ATP-dependent DNA helicase RecG
VGDFLGYLPSRHEDLRGTHTIASAPLNEKVTIRGTVSDIKLVRLRGGKALVQAKFFDSEGDSLEIVWFNQPHIKRMLREEHELSLTGKVQERGSKLQMQSPVWEETTSQPLVHGGRVVPVYPQHDILTSKWIREKMTLLKPAIELIEETLPKDVVKDEKLLSRKEAISAMHFPEDPEVVERAKDRLAFEQMYEMQEEALRRRAEWQSNSSEKLKTPMDATLIRSFFTSLNFTPTNSQKIAMYEILQDMEKDVPMSRLLEGDVGSGKTLVATAVITNVMKNGGQTAILVPTEVLAQQHTRGIHKLLHEFEKSSKNRIPVPHVALLTGSTLKSDAETIKRQTAQGMVHVLIGTHALLESDVVFRDLRFVVMDEQHRFGVQQRRRLIEKGTPHVLSMTATPIPRTLALTAFGDHDLSVLLEKPGRRVPIETRVVPPSGRQTVELFIDKHIEEGKQVFVICPLIKEGDEEIRSVEAEEKRLKEVFRSRRISLLHGKLTPDEKKQIMSDFREKKSDILVSTSVIEVGIDIPNATIIVIEGAERFGLAQLHQLRGRVGRGDAKSFCFLFTTEANQASSTRLKAMEEHESGFTLAEIDLKIRGPGELYGLRQSGMATLTETRLFQPELIQKARKAVEKHLGITRKHAPVVV